MFSGFCNRAIRRHGPVGPRAGKRTESGAFSSANYAKKWGISLVPHMVANLWGAEYHPVAKAKRLPSMSRILLFSDSHGVPAALRALRARVGADAPDVLCFLGDALYHGPRNGVPVDYDTKAAAAEFNAMADRIVAVRGNCDAEIDQMMLAFPMMGPCATVVADGARLFLSHGHAWGPDEALPPLPAGTVVATGHTHVPTVQRVDGVWCFNPGSISLPKGGSEPSYAVLDGLRLEIRRLADGATLRVADLSA